MIGTLVTVHGLIRWVLLVLAVVVVARYAIGWLGKRSFTPLDKQLGSIFAIALTVQFVLGLINLLGLASMGAFRPGPAPVHAAAGR